MAELESLVIALAPEKELDKNVTKHPVLMTTLLRASRTGHHGAWVLPKQIVRTRLPGDRAGYIPDFILGGKSSDGFSWSVVEVKGADSKLFSRVGGGIRLSSVGNRGVCQLLGYVDYCSEVQPCCGINSVCAISANQTDS